MSIKNQTQTISQPSTSLTYKVAHGWQAFWRKNKVAYLFLLPWFIGIFILGVLPMLASLYLSFTDYDFRGMPDWIGLKNYVEMFTVDRRYLKSLQVTSLYVLIGVPLQLCFALIVALMLDKGIPGLSFFRAIYYVPSLLGGSVAIAILWRQVFGRSGIFNGFLGIFGIEGISWYSHPDYALYTIILLKVWQFGSPMVIFLAGLRQIPEQYYEAAAIDGAGPLSQFFRITMPLLTPIILFNLIMQLISAFQAFTPAFVISGGTGGALDSVLFYTLLLYIKAFTQFQMGYASAMAWTMVLILAAGTGVIFLIFRRWVYYES
jgi:multiple sugar transport system permease protein